MPPWKVSGWLTIATRNRRQQPAAPWLLRLGGPMVVVVLPLLHRCALRHPAPAVTVLEGRPWVELLWLGRYRQLLRLSQHRQAVGLLATPAVHDARGCRCVHACRFEALSLAAAGFAACFAAAPTGSAIASLSMVATAVSFTTAAKAAAAAAAAAAAVVARSESLFLAGVAMTARVPDVTSSRAAADSTGLCVCTWARASVLVSSCLFGCVPVKGQENTNDIEREGC